ncbi:hypothetical protein LAT59_03365 [Candidatus Gracilibacteria bacterium]|nr:hypothetical protein [Candidatus Gracilibacteria bacterium]
MILYIEKQAWDYPQTQKIYKMFGSVEIIYIDHYKNIFDKHTSGLGEEKSIILAKLTSPAISEAPPGYGHTSRAYFFKTSLGCVYSGDYCFLKGAFRTDHMVYFVNYDEIISQIDAKITELQNPHPSQLCSASTSKLSLRSVSHLSPTRRDEASNEIWFYSSDWSDIQGMDKISGFNEIFIPFFEIYSGVNMEIRTKSGNISSLLELGFVPKNTEIAFSLNPQELIARYEHGTASLAKRLESINILLEKGFRVGIRLLPLLPVKGYKEIYSVFFTELSEKLPLEKLSSSFASGLLYTRRDYKVMLKKYPGLDILHYLTLEDDDFYRESREVRNWFYSEVKKLDKKCLLCLEK